MPQDVDEMPGWLVQSFVARGHLIEAKDDLLRAEVALLPRLKNKNDVQRFLSACRRRVTSLLRQINPPKKMTDADYTLEWRRLTRATGQGVVTNRSGE